LRPTEPNGLPTSTPERRWVFATLGSALTEAASVLRQAGFEDSRRHARRLLGAALGLTASEILAHPERPLFEEQRRRLHEFLRRMAAREPLSRIVGRREFWGLEFRLSLDTLDPRPETETLVEAILRRRPDRAAALRLLDLGTGSGCLLLALLREYPNSTGVGVDIAEGAAACAGWNARVLGFGDRAQFIVGDWATALSGHFDAIVANPPYVAAGVIRALPPEVGEYDPHRALDGGPDGLDRYRAIAPDIARLLRREGVLAVEIGAGQADAVAGILESHGLRIDAISPDLAGIPRCVVASLR